MTISPLHHRLSNARDALSAAFPARAIVVHYGGVLHNTMMWVGMALLFGALAAFSVYASLPDIIHDLGMNGAAEAEVDPTANVEGACRTMKFIFIDCNATIRYRRDQASAEVTEVQQSFLFLGTSANTTVDVLRSKAHPERVTTSLATSHLGNRIFTLLLVSLILGGLSAGAVREGWASIQRRRLEGKAVQLRPVIATLLQSDEHGNVTFEARIDGKTVKAANRLREGDLPLCLPASDGQVLAVAVVGTSYLILLDDDLSVLDVSDSERAQIKAALGWPAAGLAG